MNDSRLDAGLRPSISTFPMKHQILTIRLSLQSVFRFCRQIYFIHNRNCTAGRSTRFYHGYYHAYCYLPRLVFCNGWPVRTKLRTSSGDVAAGVVETIAPLVDRLRKRFPQVPILIRSDEAYCRDEWMHVVRGAGRGLRAGTAAQ